MKNKFIKAAAYYGFLGLAALAWPVAAHHATTIFDAGKLLPLTGTVKEVHWKNPHVEIVVETTDVRGASSGLWVIELPSPGNLVRSGWTRAAVKPGDKVAADIHPLRDGSKGGALRKITLSDTGVSYAYNIRDQERPNEEQQASR